ncbi:bifunctional 5,10-methylenetetrahydrofolate dehydrogenase/5,10-methenyltetrahydrofolate cyclohydrolase [Exiguobacterium sp. ZOR0005]|uniref:bifunctional 5,10-methylenetetrahydrofolate dehydrogenase/5,10-methenyltetrahydrofolate cyclohydrolase n=1 Tax=Exiguobacterium sp. ZOR0005 TaxID=1339226 RepID=UPI0004626C4E|nr:bifunctional methylenetetrahydrofolate dehydrogenase/methenyltetrahydrofolate cyclohydrolase [Exiguobacterium sp. ZOR0005]
MAVVIDGKQIATSYRETLKERVAALRNKGIVPKLKVVLIGDDPASHSYVRGKERAAAEIGIDSQVLRFDETISEQEILTLIDSMNEDDDLHGILVQLPLPKHIDENRVIMRISPEKDVDGFHPENVGKMMLGLETLLPCTPHGILHLAKLQTDLVGKHVVVVGRSQIVGKPVGMLFLNESATVTYCHSKTVDLGAMTRQADILIVAVGRAGLVTKDMVKPGAIVIDVGVNRVDNRLVGDVDYEQVKDVAGAITPVPGGVGPMTITMLMHNTVEVASRG